MIQKRMGSLKKKVSGIAVLLLVLSLLFSGTYAAVILFQHDSNELNGSVLYHDATLNEVFTPVANWKVSDEDITKQINVKNTGLNDGTYGNVYVRIQLKEYMEIKTPSYHYYDVNQDDIPELYMTNPDGSYAVYSTEAEAANAFPGHEYAELTDAVTGVTGWFVRTMAGDKNGQYGKYVVQSIEKGAAESLIPGVERATNVEYGNHGENGECAYTPHLWDPAFEEYAKTALFEEYVQWNLGDEVISLEEWDGNPVDKWILDTTSPDGWIYWGRALAPQETTADLMESIRLIQQPAGEFYYVIHSDMEAVPFETLRSWGCASEKVIKAYEKMHLVAFDPEDGTFEEGGYPALHVINVREGERILARPADPVRENYTFVGWAYSMDSETGNDLFWDFDTNIVRHNTTLWAVWRLADPV